MPQTDKISFLLDRNDAGEPVRASLEQAIYDLLASERERVITDIQTIVETKSIGLPDQFTGWRDIVETENLLAELERMKDSKPVIIKPKAK